MDEYSVDTMKTCFHAHFKLNKAVYVYSFIYYRP